MNNLGANLSALWANGHVKWAIIISAALEIIPFWFPIYKTPCMETQKVLFYYGLAAAANSGPKPPNPINA